MKPIDIHTHLSSKEFDEDRNEVMQRAAESCQYIIDIGVGENQDCYDRSLKLAETYDFVYFTAGIHPHDAQTRGMEEGTRKKVEELLAHPKCVAVGECGLDYYYELSPKREQQAVFQWQIDLAQKFQLPLMIHTRDAEDDTKSILRDYSGKAVFHCFTGTTDLAQFGVSKGFKISISGIATFKKSHELRQTIQTIPLKNLLIETDSPYLAPMPLRGKRNESSYIEHTACFLAEFLEVKRDDFVRATNQNTLEIFSRIE